MWVRLTYQIDKGGPLYAHSLYAGVQWSMSSRRRSTLGSRSADVETGKGDCLWRAMHRQKGSHGSYRFLLGINRGLYIGHWQWLCTLILEGKNILCVKTYSIRHYLSLLWPLVELFHRVNMGWSPVHRSNSVLLSSLAVANSRTAFEIHASLLAQDYLIVKRTGKK